MSLQERLTAPVDYVLVTAGGPGSGWTAENGHVPGSQGGSDAPDTIEIAKVLFGDQTRDEYRSTHGITMVRKEEHADAILRDGFKPGPGMGQYVSYTALGAQPLTDRKFGLIIEFDSRYGPREQDEGGIEFFRIKSVRKAEPEEIKAWRTLGGPGSGWTAENGHVPGSQGGVISEEAKNSALDWVKNQKEVGQSLTPRITNPISGSSNIEAGGNPGWWFELNGANKRELIGRATVEKIDSKQLVSSQKTLERHILNDYIRNPEKIGEIVVTKTSGITQILDGNHRAAAARLLGISIKARVIDSSAVRTLGGPGSGNFGHAGRPGQVGGSGEGGEVGAQLRFHSIPFVGNPALGLKSVELALLPGAETNKWKFIESRVKVDWSKLPAGVSKENVVGSVFIFQQKKKSVGSDLHVDSRYRRQGIASTLYKHVEGATGQKLTPEQRQTSEGEAFWSGRHLASKSKFPIHTLGGPGSGNFGHAGRPGQVGGSGDATATAEGVARKAHATQVDRQGVFYIEHVSRVVDSVSDAAKPVAWLHDAIEDTPHTRETLLAEGVPAKVIDSVEILTRQRGEVYRDFISRIEQSGDQLAIEVKLADLRDNLRPGGPAGLRGRYERAIQKLEKVRALGGQARWEKEVLLGRGHTFQVVETKNGRPTILRVVKSRTAGDVEGHPFYGNQWTSEPGGSEQERAALEKGFLAYANAHAVLPEYEVNELRATNDYVRGQVKLGIIRDLSEGLNAETRLPWEKEVQRQLNMWATTSGDHLPRAVASQLAVKEEFGLADAGISHMVTPDQPIPDVSIVDKFYARREYEHTQEWFKEQGITHVTLFRGQEPHEGKYPVPKTGDVEVRMQPISSWTTSPQVARDFGKGGVVMSVRVPVSRILSTCVTGRGCLTEAEVLVLGGTMKVHAQNTNDKGWLANVLSKLRGSEVAVYDIDADLKNADWAKRTPDTMEALRAAGDVEGHPFYGNQYDAGSTGRPLDVVSAEQGKKLFGIVPSAGYLKQRSFQESARATVILTPRLEKLGLSKEEIRIAEKVIEKWQIGSPYYMDRFKVAASNVFGGPRVEIGGGKQDTRGMLGPLASVSIHENDPVPWPAGKNIPDRVFESVLRASHEEAQEYLTKKGITELIVWQGAKSSGEQTRAASSWTLSPKVAGTFANRVGERVVVARVPAKDVLSIGGRGIGAKHQWEVVLTGTHNWQKTYGGQPEGSIDPSKRKGPLGPLTDLEGIRDAGEAEGHPFHGNQWTDVGTPRPIVASLGQVGNDGSIEAMHLPSAADIWKRNHAETFKQQPDLHQRFRMAHKEVLWDAVPSVDDYFAVGDYYAKHGIELTGQHAGDVNGPLTPQSIAYYWQGREHQQRQRAAGEAVGHPFHGNQWTEGGSSSQPEAPGGVFVARAFDFNSLGTRRFMFDPSSSKFIFGNYLTNPDAARDTHAETYAVARQKGDEQLAPYDEQVRGLFYGVQDNGTPPMIVFDTKSGAYLRGGLPDRTYEDTEKMQHNNALLFDAVYKAVESFVAHGAPSDTEVFGLHHEFFGKGSLVGRGGALGELFPELFKRQRAAALRSAKRPSTGMRFDQSNPAAIAWARNHAAELVQDILDDAKEGIRYLTARVMTGDFQVRDMKKMLRSFIGLTGKQTETLLLLRESLDEQGVEGADLEDEIDARREEMLNYRAETIASTETMRAANEGQQELWEQAVDDGQLTGNEMKEWITTPDDRLAVANRTPVMTTKGWVHVNHIKVGDYVLTHKDRFCRVAAIFAKRYDGPMVSFKIGGRAGIKVSVTPNHPILIGEDWIDAENVKLTDVLTVFAKPCAGGCGQLLKSGPGQDVSFCSVCAPQESNKVRWNDPAQHDLLSWRNRERWAEPGRKEEMSEAIKVLWKDPAYLAHMDASERGRRDKLLKFAQEGVIGFGAQSYEDLIQIIRDSIKSKRLPTLSGDVKNEQILKGLLEAQRLEYLQQWEYEYADQSNEHRKGFADFYLPGPKLVIECVSTKIPSEVLGRRPRVDALKKQGVRYLEFTLRELQDGIHNVASEIRKHCCFVRLGPKQITYKTVARQTVYDLRVEEDESFVAGGIVVHNCPICEAMDGVTVRLDEDFDFDGEPVTTPPGHPRCRCTVGLSLPRAAEEADLRSATVRKVGRSWVLYTKDGSKVLGRHTSREGALAQERAIYASKARAAGEGAGHEFHGNQWTGDTTAFHGSAEENLKSILRYGIRPKYSKVYATSSLEEALGYARGAGTERRRSVVFEVSIPKSAIGRFEPRTKGRLYPEKSGDHIVYRGQETIPPAWIKAVHEPNKSGKMVRRELSDGGASIVYVAVILEDTEARAAGEAEGHPFHGNQFTDGGVGATWTSEEIQGKLISIEAAKEAIDETSSFEDKANPNKLREYSAFDAISTVLESQEKANRNPELAATAKFAYKLDASKPGGIAAAALGVIRPDGDLELKWAGSVAPGAGMKLIRQVMDWGREQGATEMHGTAKWNSFPYYHIAFGARAVGQANPFNDGQDFVLPLVVRRSLGDVEGHPFYGNQWTSEGGGSAEEISAVDKAFADVASKHGGFHVSAKDAGETIRARTKEAIVEQFKSQVEPDVREAWGKEVQRNLDQWAVTSGDSSPVAVARQVAVAAEFDIKDAAIDHLRTTSSHVPEIDQLYARAEYENTQRWFKEQGITHVTVYRGEVNAGQTHDGHTEVRMQPASSWTTDLETAKTFAMDTGYVMATRVPVARVLSTAVTGRGCLTESEILLLGGRLKVYMAQPSEGWQKRLKGSLRGAEFVKQIPVEVLYNIDAILSNADWPKRTDDRLEVFGMRVAGEATGHEFHGNQWTDAGSGTRPDFAKEEAEDRAIRVREEEELRMAWGEQIDTFSAAFTKPGESCYWELDDEGAAHVTLDVPDAKIVRTISYSESGNLRVVHEGFEVEDDKQGAGIAKDVLERSFQAYDKMGVLQVKLQANVDVGKYAWAKFGFKPEHPDNFVKVAESAIEKIRMNGSISRADEVVLARLLNNGPADESAWRLADHPLGRTLMTDPYFNSWPAVMTVSDKSARARLAAYVKTKSTPHPAVTE